MDEELKALAEKLNQDRGAHPPRYTYATYSESEFTPSGTEVKKPIEYRIYDHGRTNGDMANTRIIFRTRDAVKVKKALVDILDYGKLPDAEES